MPNIEIKARYRDLPMMAFRRFFQLASILLGLLLISCSSGMKKSDPSLGTGKPTIISFEQDFRDFWKRARDQPLERQFELWDEWIENPHRLFYDSVVWERSSHPHWVALKRRLLPSQFELYRTQYDEILSRFRSFEQVTQDQLVRFQKAFPDARFDFPIYASLSPTFNAKGAVLGGAGQPVVLAFGIDTFLAFHDRYDIVYPHELFHIYHALRSGFLNDGVMENLPLTVPLWEEGLAVYVSGILNPGATEAELLDDKDLGRVPDREVKRLAHLFLAQADRLAVDPAHPEIFKSWFSAGPTNSRAGIPSRCAYLLGLRVARRLAKTHTLNEMTGWTPTQSRPHVRQALMELAE